MTAEQILSSARLLQSVPRALPENWMRLGDLTGDIIQIETSEALAYLESVRRGGKWQRLWRPGKKAENNIANPQIVLVFGSSGSGKDVVVSTILGEMGDDVTAISADWYYGPLGETEEGKKVFSNNYDHPNSVDWGLLRWHLNLLQQGFVVRAPVYDFTVHSRVDQSKELRPNRILLVSGIMVAHALRDRADFVIGVDAPWGVCVKRRIGRDVRERGRQEEECRVQIEATVRPGDEEYVRPYIDELKQGGWDGEAMLVDNAGHANWPGKEPARINGQSYLEPIRALMAAS